MDLCRKTVVKLGGSVLSSRKNIAAVPKLVSLYENPVLVVSALAGVTQALTDFISGLKGPVETVSVEDFLARLRGMHLDSA